MLNQWLSRFFGTRTAKALPTNNFPDFIIAGAQKAGTSALYNYLAQHPQIQATKEKELHYFDCQDQYERGVEFYKSFFQLDIHSKLTFDASAGYLECAKAPSRIYAHNPNVKIIIVLRDPIERAYSAWNMYKKLYSINRNWFDEWCSSYGVSDVTILKRQDDRLFDFLHYILDEIEFQKSSKSSMLLEAQVLCHGHYHEQIQRYLSLFNENQILILENSEMKMNTVKCLQEVESFLGIPGCNWRNMNTAPVFEGDYSNSIDSTTKRVLLNYYTAGNERLFELLGRRYEWCTK